MTTILVRRILLASILLVLAPAALRAQALADYDYDNLTLRGVGLSLGYIWPTTVEPTPTYHLRIDLGYLGPGVRLVPTIGFWSSELREEELNRLEEELDVVGDISGIDWSDLSLQLNAHYVWITPVPDLFTYLGAGIGLHARNGGGPAIDDTFFEDLLDSVGAGASAIGGVEFAVVDRFRLYGELRYTLSSDIRYPGVRIGGQYMLPAGERVGAEEVLPGGE